MTHMFYTTNNTFKNQTWDIGVYNCHCVVSNEIYPHNSKKFRSASAAYEWQSSRSGIDKKQ